MALINDKLVLLDAVRGVRLGHQNLRDNVVGVGMLFNGGPMGKVGVGGKVDAMGTVRRLSTALGI
jgi:hypothetical protein